MGIFIALIVLSVIVFFHELGHFAVARLMGVRVDVFSIGFGKKIYSKMIGQTEWSVSLIPLGGYVKMKGQDDTDPTKISYDEDSYNSKKPWQRILILLAGPFANFVLAFILYMMIANIGVPKLLPIVGTVGENTPAMSAKLQKDDKILSVNGTKILYWEEIGKQINSIKSGDINLIIERDHKEIEFALTPKIIEDKNIFEEPIKRRIIGISPTGESVEVVFGFFGSIDYAWNETKKASVLIFTSVQKLITGAVSTDKLGGVITIVDVTSQASSAGLLSLFFFSALISVNLGVLNLLPIPALDGGHIMFNLYEMIRGKAPTDNALYYMTMVGWVLLFGLMFLGLYNDINRLIGG
ncbi:Membrane-associated zinc metalloprotease [hydrothermal vent metagenome]|uniref:Membrane-associated zinc metalloprotease n=1 Tax=hydrothermal vent metagenome TaxID=652676 RepID=A0A1W1BDY9_9ZZZZ